MFRDYPEPRRDRGSPFRNLRQVLETLWQNRDAVLTSPEDDTATGRELINNILACKGGDEGECGLGTAGGVVIDWYVPSPDGATLAVSLSRDGAEAGDLHLFDVATGAATGEIEPGVILFARIAVPLDALPRPLRRGSRRRGAA